MISPRNKLLLKRFVARQLRRLVDLLDDRLHAWEVSLRTEKGLPTLIRSAAKREPVASVRETPPPARVSYMQWEARRSGVSVSARPRRRRAHGSSADFDRELREHFSRSAS